MAVISSSALPVVDLGYVRQRATTYDAMKDIYIFSNIRYAQPPTGNLRWAPPQAPLPESEVQTGEQDRICFQSQPYWQMNLLGPWVEAVVGNMTDAFYDQFPEQPSPPNDSPDSFPDILPSETEDCLFLDVYVPRKVFEDSCGSKVPVVVWIHGGGLILGSKTADGGYEGLVAQSMTNGSEPIILVSINYRLGAFGFLGGPALRAAGGTSNSGLLDQRFALEWVQSNIHLFGGDATRVTAMGESGGGACLIHHIVSYGGQGPVLPFQRAIIQSGGWNPTYTTDHLDYIYGTFLAALNVSSFQEAQASSSLALRNANFIQEYSIPWGGLGAGIEADGEYVPAPAPELLLNGRFHRSISVLTGQTANEGVLFASPWGTTDDRIRQFATAALPDTPVSVIDYILGSQYPPPSANTSLLYTDDLSREQIMAAEAGILCHSATLAHAFGNKTYNYLFNILPAFHGDDINYAFFDPADNSSTAIPEVALGLQSYLLNFARDGDPNDNKIKTKSLTPIRFERYGGDAWTLEVTENGFLKTINPGENSRCDWWRNGFYRA